MEVMICWFPLLSFVVAFITIASISVTHQKKTKRKINVLFHGLLRLHTGLSVSVHIVVFKAVLNAVCGVKNIAHILIIK